MVSFVRGVSAALWCAQMHLFLEKKTFHASQYTESPSLSYCLSFIELGNQEFAVPSS